MSNKNVSLTLQERKAIKQLRVIRKSKRVTTTELANRDHRANYWNKRVA